MGSTKVLRRRRDNLFKQHPYCHWCKCKLLHPKFVKKGDKQPNNMATIDHLRNRLDFNRTEPNTTRESRTVLSCRKCNQDRSEESVSLLTKEELWSRSGSYPLTIITGEDMNKLPLSKAVTNKKTAKEIITIVKDTLLHQQMLVHNRLEINKTPIRLGYQACLLGLIKELRSKDESLEIELQELLEDDSRFIKSTV